VGAGSNGRMYCPSRKSYRRFSGRSISITPRACQRAMIEGMVRTASLPSVNRTPAYCSIEG
jgi:hypothetical protein